MFLSLQAKPNGTNGTDSHDSEPPSWSCERNNLSCTDEVRILVLDDDDQVCRLIEGALAPNGYSIDSICEPSGMEVQLQARSYHIIVLDYVIPTLRAEQILDWIHAYQPEASVVVVTAYPSIEGALNCLRARTYDYLTKPFPIGQLQRIVTRCLESKGLLRLSNEALRESLGQAIRDRRKTLGLTLAQLAERTKMSLGYLSQIELGKNSASIEKLYRISLGLGLKLAELFQMVQT